MLSEMIYICSFCKNRSSDKNEILACENKHAKKHEMEIFDYSFTSENRMPYSIQIRDKFTGILYSYTLEED